MRLFKHPLIGVANVATTGPAGDVRLLNEGIIRDTGEPDAYVPGHADISFRAGIAKLIARNWRDLPGRRLVTRLRRFFWGGRDVAVSGRGACLD